MNKQLVLWIAVSGLVAGCAGLTGDEAPVEDRMGGGRAAPSGVDIVEAGSSGTRAAAAGETKPGSRAGDGAGMSTQGMKSTQITESGQAAAGQSQGGGVETRAMPSHLAGSGQIQGGGQVAGGGSGPAGVAEGVHGGGKDGASSLGEGMDLNSPGSILAKRVIYFDYDSSALRDEFRTLMEAHATYLKAHRSSKVLLQGHADERGSREYNLALGQRRAEGVQQAFALLGVDTAQMEAVSLGEEKPAAEGHDESAWALNRRTEILYQGE